MPGTKTKSATDTDILLGDRIRAMRLQRGASQTSLAQRVGVTFQQVQKYEKGTNRVSFSRLEQIAKALEVPMSAFTSNNAVPNEFVSGLSFLSKPGVMEIAAVVAKIDDARVRRDLIRIAKH